jgi:hypothetical protein
MSRLFKGHYGCTFGHISFSSDLQKQEELRRKIHTRHLGVHMYINRWIIVVYIRFGIKLGS